MSIDVKMSKQLRKLRMKYIMNWEELEKEKLKKSWIYRAVSSFSKLPHIAQLLILSYLLALIIHLIK